MRRNILLFASGLATGLMCFAMMSADVSHTGVTPAPRTDDIDGRKFINVPIKEFFSDVARYNNTHVALVEPKMPANQGSFAGFSGLKDKRPKNASRMFIYSVETLDEFFNVVKACAARARIPHSKLAIRFYYGVYPDGQKIARENYSNLHTLFMVPNYWSEAGGRYYDFDIRRLAQELRTSGGYGHKNPEDVISQFFIERMYLGDPGQGVFMLDASSVRYTGAFPVQRAGFLTSAPPPPPVINQGQLCPPNCPTTSLLEVVDRDFSTVDWD